MAKGYDVKALIAETERQIKLYSPLEQQVVERLASMTYVPMGGVCVCLHVPADHEGNDYYERFRKEKPGLNAYVGYTMFETDSIPDPWVAACNGMDEIWLPSHFNVETFARAGVAREKMQVIPFEFDAADYRPAETAPLQIGDRKGFNFLSIFEWTYRKGWDVLIRAFVEEFKKDEDVRLILRSYQGGGVIGSQALTVLKQLELYIRKLGFDPENIPEIEFIDQMIPSDMMPSLYKAADCFVLPTRGEGWGIPMTESMLMEVPVIGTRWSGHMEFMNDHNAYLIDVDELVPVSGEQVRDNMLYEGHKWAEPSVAHTRKLMRHVFENRTEAKERGRIARDHVIQNFTGGHAAAKAVRRVMALENRQPRTRIRDAQESSTQVRDSQETHTRTREEAPTRTRGQAPALIRRDLLAGKRILFSVRADLHPAPGDDTKNIYQLKSRLEQAGMYVDITTVSDVNLDEYDLVHHFSMEDLIAHLAAMKKKPFIFSPSSRYSSQPDREAMQIMSLLTDLMNGGEDQIFRSELARMRTSPPQDVPGEHDFLFSQAEAVVVSGDSAGRQILASYPHAQRLQTVMKGFEQDPHPTCAHDDLFFREYGLRDFVLCTAPLRPLNNQLMLLYALANDEVPLVFVNQKQIYGLYEDACFDFKRKGPTIFTDEISREMLLSAYRAAKVYVRPGWGDFHDTLAMEAGSFGCNVVESWSGATADCFQERAWHCDPCDPDSVADAVRNALHAPVDPAVAPYLSQYTWASQADKIMSIYEAVFQEIDTPEGEARLAAKQKSSQEEMAYRQWRLNAYYAMGSQPAEVLEPTTRMLQQKGQDPLLWFIAGTCSLMLSNYKDAVHHFRKCVELKPVYNLKAYLSLYLSLMRTGRAGEAVELILEIIALHPLSPTKTRTLLLDYLRKASGELASAFKAGRTVRQGAAVENVLRE